jgi:hypothetical protein
MVEKGAGVGESSLKCGQQGNGTGEGPIILQRLEGGVDGWERGGDQDHPMSPEETTEGVKGSKGK